LAKDGGTETEREAPFGRVGRHCGQKERIGPASAPARESVSFLLFLIIKKVQCKHLPLYL